MVSPKKKTLANPGIWGTGAWRLLHCIAATYPKKPTDVDKKRYENFVRHMGPVLPCRYCRDHMIDFLKIDPIRPSLVDRQQFMRWTIRFHNSVNTKLGYPTLGIREALHSMRTLCL